MQHAQLVAVEIAHIAEVQRSHRANARAGCVFDRGAASGNGRIVEGLHLLKAVAGKADGRAVRGGRGLVVDRLRDRETGSL